MACATEVNSTLNTQHSTLTVHDSSPSTVERKSLKVRSTGFSLRCYGKTQAEACTPNPSWLQQPTLRRTSLFSDVVSAVLNAGRSACFRATGGSMNPTIREGDRVTVEPVAPSAIRVGDIVLYRNDRSVIAHRVVKIEACPSNVRSAPNPSTSCPIPDTLYPIPAPPPPAPRPLLFILRGDASSTSDEPVESGRILGKVVAVEQAGRRIALSNARARILYRARRWASRLKAWCRGVGRIPAHWRNGAANQK
jgi:hypothetical protein